MHDNYICITFDYMNIHLLRLFEAVALQRSFTLAAKTLSISQPAVSKGVRDLEGQLGLALLERGPGGLKLTEAGNILISHARNIFNEERDAEQALASLKGLQGGSLRIGASTTIATRFLPRYLEAFHRDHPNVELHLKCSNTQAVAEALIQRELDIALVEGPVTIGEIDVLPWLEDELVFVAASKHPFTASNTPITVSQLESEIFVIREEGSGTREVAFQALAKLNLKKMRTFEVGANEAVTQIVGAGIGIGVVSSVVAADAIALGRLRIFHVEGLSLRRTLTRLVLRGRRFSPAAAAFERLLNKKFG